MRSEYQVMLIAWVLVSVWVAIVIYANRKVHPKVLFFLFMTELWERFSYYGMRALLVLYLTAQTVKGGFGIEAKSAYGIYAAYGALVYLTPLAGGLLADRLLGFRNSIIWGAILMAGGQFTLAASAGSQLLLYSGLAMLVIGNGFFKPNISSLIGRFYPQGDPRRDGAFTIFYMGINIGAFLTPLTCGTVGELEGWGYGFLLAGIGMLIGLGIFLYTVAQGYLEHHGDPPTDEADMTVGPGAVIAEPEPAALTTPTTAQLTGMTGTRPGQAAPAETSLTPTNPPTGPGGQPTPGSVGDPNWRTNASYLVYLGTFLFLPVAGLLIYYNDVMDYLLGGIGLAAIAYMLYLSSQYPVVERQRVWVIVVLLVFTAIFWTFFELAGSALNLFTETNVNRTLFGLDFPTSNYQAVNPIFIMVFAPLFSMLWIWLAKTGREPAAPIKFALGLFLLGAGFLVLNLGTPFAVAGMVPAIFLILLYLLHTLGELVLSPVGLSLVTKLAPAKVVGFMMGFWFLSSAIAHQAGKWIARLTTMEGAATPEETLTKALAVFNNVGLVALGAGVVLLLLSPLITRWMHGIK
jgi:POT family proton-dependent oligopeptide transporter